MKTKQNLFISSFVVGILMFVASIGAGNVFAAKIPIKTKSIFTFESQKRVSFTLECLTRDNTEIKVTGHSPTEHVVFTAKPLVSCKVEKDAGASAITIKMVEGKLTDEIINLRTAAPTQTVSQLESEKKLTLVKEKKKSKRTKKSKRLASR